jgi:hypothetical protein
MKRPINTFIIAAAILENVKMGTESMTNNTPLLL